MHAREICIQLKPKVRNGLRCGTRVNYWECVLDKNDCRRRKNKR